MVGDQRHPLGVTHLLRQDGRALDVGEHQDRKALATDARGDGTEIQRIDEVAQRHIESNAERPLVLLRDGSVSLHTAPHSFLEHEHSGVSEFDHLTVGKGGIGGGVGPRHWPHLEGLYLIERHLQFGELVDLGLEKQHDLLPFEETARIASEHA